MKKTTGMNNSDRVDIAFVLFNGHFYLILGWL